MTMSRANSQFHCCITYQHLHVENVDTGLKIELLVGSSTEKNIQKHLTFHANSDMKTLSYLVCTVMYRYIYIYIVSIFKVVFGRSPDETGQTQQQNFVGILARCSRETGPLPPQISWLRVSWRVCDANEFLEVKSCCFRRHILTYNIL